MQDVLITIVRNNVLTGIAIHKSVWYGRVAPKSISPQQITPNLRSYYYLLFPQASLILLVVISKTG